MVNKFVKVVVLKKTDLFTFDRFIDRIQQVKTHELKIAETFEEFLGDAVDDAKVSVEDTTELLDTYIEAVETDLDKDRLKNLMRGLYVEAQNMEIV
jgi:LPS O-antigen subunit length determinant protein (WzzB/FepE family)